MNELAAGRRIRRIDMQEYIFFQYHKDIFLSRKGRKYRYW